MLQCTQCNKDLAPSNVSQLSSSRVPKQGNCKGAVAGAHGEQRVSGTVGSSSTAIPIPLHCVQDTTAAST
jgi:hypothetical protein